MRSIFLLLSAVMLGLTGGYAWSKWSGKTPAAPASASTAHAKPIGYAPNVYYANCAAARAAGAGDLYPGLPGYRAELDSNGDGVACSTGDAGA